MKRYMLLIAVIILFISSIHTVHAEEIWNVVTQTGDTTASDNNLNGGGFVSGLMNATHISTTIGSLNLISFNITCSTLDSFTVRASFCERFEDNEYTFDCINSTRVNITKGGITNFNCPRNEFVITDNISFSIDTSKNYLYNRRTDNAVERYMRFAGAAGTANGLQLEENQGYWQTNPDGQTTSHYFPDVYNLLGYPYTSPPSFVFPTPSYGEVNNTIKTINMTCNGNTYYLWFDSNSDPTTARLTDSTHQNWTMPGLSDGTTYYYKAACYNSTKGEISYNTTTRSYTYDTSSPSIISNIQDNNSIVTNNISISINLSDNIGLSNFSIYLDNYEVDTLIGVSDSFYIYNISLNMTNNLTGYHNITTSTCDKVYQCITKEYQIYKYNVTPTAIYNAQEPQDNRIDMSLRLNFSNTTITNNKISAELYYNNTRYIPTKSISNNIVTFSANPITPNITASIDDINFYWNYNVSSEEFRAGDYTQLVGDLILTECKYEEAQYTTHALNISAYWETNGTSIILDNLNQNYQVIDDDNTIYRIFNFTNSTLSNFSLCIHPNSTITSDIIIDYEFQDTHFTYYTSGFNLSNNTKVLNLYVDSGTSQITYHIVDDFESDVEGAYITVQKYNIGTNSYNTIEVLKTDVDGYAIGRAILYTTWYRFIINYQGNQVLQEGPLKLISDSKDFKIDLAGGDWTSGWDSFNDIKFALGWNNASHTFHINYSNNAQLEIDELCYNILNITNKEHTTIVEGCVTSFSEYDSIIRPSPAIGTVEGQRYSLSAWVTINGNYFYIGTLEKDFTQYKDFWKDEGTAGFGTFVAFLVILTLAMIGIWNPVMAIIFTIVGLVAVNLLGIHLLSTQYLVTAVILGIVVIWRINKAE